MAPDLALSGSFGIDGTPEAIVTDGDQIWVRVGYDEDAQIIKLDGRTGTLEATIAMAHADAMLMAEDSVWVTTDDAVARVDAVDDEVAATIPIGSPSGLASSTGSIWVAGEDGVVSRIEAAGEQVEETFPVAADIAPQLEAQDSYLDMTIAASDDTVWVSYSGTTSEERVLNTIDIQSGQMSELPLDTEHGVEDEIVPTSRGLWLNTREEVTLVDPASAEPVAVVPLQGHAYDITAIGDSVWVAETWEGSVPHLTLIDGSDPQVADSLELVPQMEASTSYTYVAATSAAVWVTVADSDYGDFVGRVDV